MQQTIVCYTPIKFMDVEIGLEFSTLRSTRERNHVADVLHTCYEEDEALEAEAEACVRT